MTLLEIVALYVALNLILAPILMMRVGQVRSSEKVSIGDGGSQLVLSRMRAHANFVESTPLVLIGLFALAGLSAAPLALHIIGGGFTFGRVAHAHGMAQENALGKGRIVGALLTLLSFLAIAFYALFLIITK